MKDLIKTIHVDKANFEHIAKTGAINGTLLLEIERVLDESTQELRRHKINLRNENDELRQKLIDAGLEKSDVQIDYSRNA